MIEIKIMVINIVLGIAEIMAEVSMLATIIHLHIIGMVV